MEVAELEGYSVTSTDAITKFAVEAPSSTPGFLKSISVSINIFFLGGRLLTAVTRDLFLDRQQDFYVGYKQSAKGLGCTSDISFSCAL